ncbi:MAG: putative DNA-binding domain-containing protein [Planctomycetes bacterium]|nr:putative DNA-binding domain-containing protein [Planctomycetota bacterium]
MTARSRPSPPPSLRSLQRWFAAVVEHPATADVALRSRAAAAIVPPAAAARGAVVLGNARMTPAERLQVYNGAYLARLLEVLQGDFGALQQALGEDRFRALVAKFVVAHPSRHPNLNQLGRPLPGFVARQRDLPHRPFLAELATLERAVSDAFDAPEFTPLANDRLAAVPPERWATARLTLNPSVQLCAFRHPVDEWYQAWKEGRPRPVPARAASWLVVFRRDDRVWRQRLERPAFAVLAALAEGVPLAPALERARGAAAVGEWFQGFARDGLFTAVDLRRRR